MSKKLKAGIVGLGVGQRHIQGYLSHPQCEVKSICDLDENKLKKIGEEFSISAQTKSFEDITDDPDIDIISICSYDNFHAQQVIRALEKGKDVMVEKPLCASRDEAQAILKTLKATGRRLTSNLILRKSPRFINLKNQIAQGRFGDIFYIEGDYLYGRGHKITDGWRGKLDFYCGVYGGGVHVIDLMSWFVGSEVDEVVSYGNNICTKDTEFKFEDCVVAILKFKNGCIGKTVTSLCCVQPHFHSLKVYGTESTFVNNYKEADWYKSPDHADTVHIDDEYPGVNKYDLIPDFIDSIIEGKPSAINEEEIFNTMSVCFSIYDSLKSGKPTKVTYIK